MGAVIAGFAAGYTMAIFTTIAITYLITRPGTTGLIDRILDPEVPRGLVAVPVFVGASLLWPLIGLVIGSIYEVAGFADGPAAMGTKNIGFAAAMVVVGVLPVPVLVALWARHWWLWLGMGALFALAFGWMLPVLEAQW
jgi:hypothetical protein